MTMKKILCLRYATVFPNDLLDCFEAAVFSCPFRTDCISLEDIKLFSAYSPDGTSFLGSCFGVKRDDKCYIYFVGSNKIYEIKKDEFILKETDDIVAPVMVKKNFSHVFRGKYSKENNEDKITVYEIEKSSVPNFEKIETIHSFSDGICFNKALVIYYDKYCK